MERIEAILEQLKKAQSRGMETIQSRLDVVVQGLEELVQEAKSSVRGALPESADDCLPIGDVEAALTALGEEADSARARVAELEAEIDGLRGASGAAAGPSLELMRTLAAARSQSELLKELLPAISEHAARAVVLVLRDGSVSAWSGIGFADGEVLRGWQGEAAESPALVRLLEASGPVRFEPDADGVFLGWLADEPRPEEMLLIPVVLRGKLMGAVYVDRLEEQPWDPGVAQSLVAQVCWLIDTLQYRSGDAPQLADPVTVEAGHAPAPEPEPEPAEAEIDPSATMRVDVTGVDFGDVEFEGEQVVETGSEAEDTPPAADEPEPQLEAEVAEPEPPTEPEPEIAAESFEPEPEPAADSFVPGPPVEPEHDAAGETFEPEPEPAAESFVPEPPAEPEPVAPAEAEHEGEPAEPPAGEAPPEVQPVAPPDEPTAPSSRFLDEPPPVQPVQPPPDEPEEEVSEDEAQREEARRFARLLVSEIKLYNEEQVEKGREAGDIYQRLQEDIDRSREMFDKRISAEVRSERDYFTDELVRILADGDADALGM